MKASRLATAVLLVALALPLAGCPRPGPELPEGTRLTEKEREALELAATMTRISRDQGDAVWPGYLPHEIPLLIFRPGRRSFLVNPELPPVGLERVTARGLKLDAWFVPPGRLRLSPNLPFAKEVEVAGNVTFMVRHTDGSHRAEWFRLVVHEMFHYHQHTAWAERPFPDTCRYPYEDLENAHLARVEERVLGRLLPRPDVAGFRERALTYLRLRRERHAGGPERAQAAAIEAWEERVEGTARFTEERYAIAAGLTTPARVRTRLASYFTRFRPKDLQKWKYYKTGAGLALLLDFLEVPDWKLACEKGSDPFAFAVQALHEELNALDDALLTTALERHAEARQESADAIVAYLEEEARLFRTWEEEGTYRIRVLLPRTGSAYYTNRGVTFLLADCSRLATRILHFVDNRYGLDVRGRGVAVLNDAGRYEIVFHADLKSLTLELDGQAVTLAEGNHDFGQRIRVEAKGWTIDTAGRGKFIVNGREVVLRLNP